MKNFTLLLFVLLLGMSSCNRTQAPGKERRFMNTTYVHLFFETEEECLAAQPDPDFFINCHQQVDFLEDNEVQLMLTDIIWTGEYHVVRNMLILEFEPNFEIPNGVVSFEIINNNDLRKMDDSSDWKKMKGDSIWD